MVQTILYQCKQQFLSKSPFSDHSLPFINKIVYIFVITYICLSIGFMFKEISIIKGIHPGLILERKLQEMKLKKSRFAITIKEYPQTLTAITKGKRGMNPALAFKIEQALGLEEGYLMVLQAFYEMKEEKLRQHSSNVTPDLSRLRPGLFWDTDINTIDWQGQKRAVIERVIERGSEEEKAEIKRFYGEKAFNKIAGALKLQHA
jgi:antitoxin HigA-1